MQTFAELIAESYHSEVNLIWKLNSTRHAVATFRIKTVSVDVDFEQREPNGSWHVGFNTHRGQADDRNYSLAFRIFNGVFQAVREFLETRQPERIVFIAKDEDLAGVYRTYLRRELPNTEALGYRLEGPHTVDPYTEWTLRRIAPTAWVDQTTD
jgi:hypothetical protein